MIGSKLLRTWLYALLLLGACGSAYAEDQKLFLYNWADFIGTKTVQRFEALTGIKVVYDTYDAEETMEARLFPVSPAMTWSAPHLISSVARSRRGSYRFTGLLQAAELAQPRSANSGDSRQVRSG